MLALPSPEGKVRRSLSRYQSLSLTIELGAHQLQRVVPVEEVTKKQTVYMRTQQLSESLALRDFLMNLEPPRASLTLPSNPSWRQPRTMLTLDYVRGLEHPLPQKQQIPQLFIHCSWTDLPASPMGRIL